MLGLYISVMCDYDNKICKELWELRHCLNGGMTDITKKKSVEILKRRYEIIVMTKEIIFLIFGGINLGVTYKSGGIPLIWYPIYK